MLFADVKKVTPQGLIVFEGGVYAVGPADSQAGTWPAHAYADTATWDESTQTLILSGSPAIENLDASYRSISASASVKLSTGKVESLGRQRSYLSAF